ncbi:type VII secretion-associated serine protease mycosin [Actinokineospora auranticolor]|uniref:Membrane-anchored mycosin MYCP n=1 Tax=Actinokineospora auranticolor TaxID=155976 RepID=A0A2S6GWL5_9PSEU|nr:type VII secretion-associated serine protease mycosin [Actinokineospora auranticolor]PPK69570.1 membrane-anchored mycosin MYCP [Actinokineospora auranticolor]
MRRTASRLAASITVAAIAVALPLPAAAQPSSQPSSPAPAKPDSMAKPPPLPADFPLPGGTDPDTKYNLANECIGSLNQGTDLKNKPWGQLQLRFDELHHFATGKGQVVAVIDTGVKQHAYFGGRVLPGGDFVIPDKRGLEDCDGHGTEVAGIIAANPPAGSDIGFKGIAPDAQILSIRQSSANYKGNRPTAAKPEGEDLPAGTLETLAKAVVSAANQGASVINMSVDNCRPVASGPITEAEKQLQAALRYAFEQKNVVLVASAGNTGEHGCPDQRNGIDPNRPTHIVTPPWFSDYVISVAAMNRNGDPAEFSVQGPWVTVAAPGTDIISLDPATDGLANMQVLPGNKQVSIQGTSFAAPYVAGLAALIRERYPELTAKQVMERVKLSSSHPAAPGGRDNLVGYGMINPIGALTTLIPSEQGVAADPALDVRAVMPAPEQKDWTPMRVALVGAGGGVLLLLLTLFVVHTVRRNRPGARKEVRGSA